MITFDCIKETLARSKAELKEKYQVKEIGVFGSYVKGKEHKSSDVDILVEFESSANISLLDFVRLENYLSSLLGVKVDLVERSALKPRIGTHVLQEVVSI
jgi:predicted nucleotidyltransferase